MPALHYLNPDDLNFPPVEEALDEPNGLLAVGGDLSSERLLHAYRQGIFPWYEDGQPILWWHPAPRMVLYPEELHVSRSLQKLQRKNTLQITADQAFPEVIEHCAGRGNHTRPGTWITAEMLDAYKRLHREGWAHSLEAWDQKQLVGGLYGIAIGSIFFGESMFSLQDNASKLVFVALVRKLYQQEFRLIDCQIASEHLAAFGAREISREKFMQELAAGVNQETHWDWENV